MSVRVLIGDVRERLKDMPDESVHCVVTSPPYFGLRDYGSATWEGGDPDCDHAESKPSRRAASVAASTLGGGKESIHLSHQFKGDCGRCGAQRIDKQIGLEPTPEAYVAELVAVFRDVRRVLRKDGTLWLNLGDSYAGGGGHSPNAPSSATSKSGKYGMALKEGGIKPLGVIKNKDLIGIPWRVAFALQADDWYLRQDIIWSKPNPMPESVRDRCTKAHEYLFLLSKSERYFYDAEAISEAAIETSRAKEGSAGESAVDRKARGSMNYLGSDGTRNRRSVWTITTQSFAEAHFATFPPELPELCIKAGCPAGGTVLDPFGGAGTTGMVADRLGRDAILIELNPEYAALAERRIHGDAGMFAQVAAE